MPTILRALPALGQLFGLLALLVGLFLLLGLAWTLVAGGVALAGVSTLAELSAPREGWKDGS